MSTAQSTMVLLSQSPMHSDCALLIVHIDGTSMALCFHWEPPRQRNVRYDFRTSRKQCYSLELIRDLSALEIRFLDVSRAATAARGLHAQPRILIGFSEFPRPSTRDSGSLTFIFTACNVRYDFWTSGEQCYNATDSLNIFGFPASLQCAGVDTTFGFPASNVLISKFLEFPRDCHKLVDSEN
ncbi:hypothetical protein BJ912DRAFT_930174 [Pholiota molesta]|nr:hypothetical protein BJ912DRAFT_930174 [Pholiota molesta]